MIAGVGCLAAFGLACGDDDGGGGTADSSVSLIDSGPQIDAGGTADAAQVACRTGFVGAMNGAEEDSDALLYQSLDATTDPFNVLSVELYYALGASSAAQTYTAFENYATCHTCVLIYADCTQAGGCTKIFEVQTGSLDITTNENADAVGLFQGTLTTAHAIEVTIDMTSFMSTPVVGGECWDIASHTMDVTSVAPPAP